MKPYQVINTTKALYNHCKKDNCYTCPFHVIGGCKLYGHPCEWEDKIKEAKKNLV